MLDFRPLSALIELRGRRSEYDVDDKTHPGMREVNQVILAVNVVHVNVVGISPVRRPWIIEPEIIAAIVEA